MGTLRSPDYLGAAALRDGSDGDDGGHGFHGTALPLSLDAAAHDGHLLTSIGHLLLATPAASGAGGGGGGYAMSRASPDDGGSGGSSASSTSGFPSQRAPAPAAAAKPSVGTNNYIGVLNECVAYGTGCRIVARASRASRACSADTRRAVARVLEVLAAQAGVGDEEDGGRSAASAPTHTHH